MSCSLHVNACFAVDDTTVDDSFPDEVPMFDFCGVKMMRVNFQLLPDSSLPSGGRERKRHR